MRRAVVALVIAAAAGGFGAAAHAQTKKPAYPGATASGIALPPAGSSARSTQAGQGSAGASAVVAQGSSGVVSPGSATTDAKSSSQ